MVLPQILHFHHTTPLFHGKLPVIRDQRCCNTTMITDSCEPENLESAPAPLPGTSCSNVSVEEAHIRLPCLTASTTSRSIVSLDDVSLDQDFSLLLLPSLDDATNGYAQRQEQRNCDAFQVRLLPRIEPSLDVR